MKKGFTLIELLAVIVILAIIALITTPTIINVIQNSKKNALKDTGYGLVEAARNYQTEKQGEYESVALNIDYSTGTNKNVLTTKGDLPNAGELQIDEDGKVSLAIWSNNAKACAVKKTSKKTITINENIKKASDCKIANIDR